MVDLVSIRRSSNFVSANFDHTSHSMTHANVMTYHAGETTLAIVVLLWPVSLLMEELVVQLVEVAV